MQKNNNSVNLFLLCLAFAYLLIFFNNSDDAVLKLILKFGVIFICTSASIFIKNQHYYYIYQFFCNFIDSKSS